LLGGISQGCATAIHALISGGTQLGGFVGLCSWMPFQEDIASILADVAKEDKVKLISSILSPTASLNVLRTVFDIPACPMLETPVFLSHSQDDNIVPIRNGETMSETLQQIGFAVTWRSYSTGGHWINEPQGIDDIVYFIEKSLTIT
jgi:predicted esterase